jgi:hypothetical protein
VKLVEGRDAQQEGKERLVLLDSRIAYPVMGFAEVSVDIREALWIGTVESALSLQLP